MAEIVKETPVAPLREDQDARIDLTGAQREGRDFLEDNQKLILGVVGAAILLGLGIFLYRQFVVEPRQAEASEQLWRAQQAFERDSFALALNTPAPGYLGLLDIAEQYGSTPAGNLANYYAGVSYLQLGQFAAAVSYLEDFDPDGTVLPAAHAGALGDAYAQTGDMAAAASQYEDAVGLADDNTLLAPYFLKKLALLRERNGDPAAANELYSRIRDEFPTSAEAADVEKFILRTRPTAG